MSSSFKRSFANSASKSSSSSLLSIVSFAGEGICKNESLMVPNRWKTLIYIILAAAVSKKMFFGIGKMLVQQITT